MTKQEPIPSLPGLTQIWPVNKTRHVSEEEYRQAEVRLKELEAKLAECVEASLIEFGRRTERKRLLALLSVYLEKKRGEEARDV